MNVVLRCLRGRALENVDHAGQPNDIRLIIESPFVGVHQAVIVPVHLLIHPDRIGDMEADGHAKFAALLPDRIHARIVGMHARSLRFSRDQAFALVVNLSHAARTRLLAPLQLLDGGGPNPGLS